MRRMETAMYARRLQAGGQTIEVPAPIQNEVKEV